MSMDEVAKKKKELERDTDSVQLATAADAGSLEISWDRSGNVLTDICIGMFIDSTCGRYVEFFFFQSEDGIPDRTVTGVQTCALPISHMTDQPQPKPAALVKELSGRIGKYEIGRASCRESVDLGGRRIIKKKKKKETVHKYDSCKNRAAVQVAYNC